jgi:HEPN domain-containing protein
VFLTGAKTLYEPQNRIVGFWFPAYYNLSHALELAIKAVVQKVTGSSAPRVHDKEELAEQYRELCNFTDSEMQTIKELKNLNNGQGGLRYDNDPEGDFLPSTFTASVELVERLIAENFQA